MVSRVVTQLRDPDRPAALSITFWLVLGLVVIRYITAPQPPLPPWSAALFAGNVALLALLWFMMPWRPVASRWRQPAVLGFLLATFALGLTGSAGVHFPLTLIGFAAVSLVYGIGIGATVAATAGVVVVVSGIWLSPQELIWVLSEVSIVVFGAVFVFGMVAATLEARRRREESERLLARVRELTISQERARMARDMHDSVGHYLTVIKMGLENAERFRTRRPDAAWTEVSQSKRLTTQALAETRRWVRALRPLDLEGRIGSAALAALARSFDGSEVTVDFELVGPEQELDADTELVLYRVLQEGLTNVVRHADAGRVVVRLEHRPDTVALEIRDDGQGGSDDHTPGFGLTSLAERVRHLGGQLTTQPDSGQGFYLGATLPAVTG
ncbi:sensor histidine kinase [Natronosporangium hydrolyticum]|uniref:histidine kinase n=1 Tax=Natronosporangium hydrolyticum TaxID=2811111 RepID=A0A895YHD6_9ACTN|nr:sensor histidine kinase [Natronosporangium hydrolyticum]QSB15465.1 sensor histidine kinase [Natronosporangium hydrolyticum]